jgi:hypothetical protein
MEPAGPAAASSRAARLKRRRLRRRNPAVASVVLLFAALGALLVGGPIVATGTQVRSDGTHSSGSSAAQARSAPPADGGDGWARDVAFRRGLQALLDERGKAMLNGDKEAFLAGVDPRAREYRRRQAKLFDAVAAVPLSVWSYTVLGKGPSLTASRRAALGQDAVTARIQFRHKIAGYDAIDVRHEFVLTIAPRGERWQIVADSDGQTPPPATGLWDFGPVTVVKGNRSLVLGLDKAAALRRYAEEVDSAIPAVSRVWGRQWPQRAVVVVPKDAKQMAAILGGKAPDYTRIAAVTTGVFDSSARKYSADRIVLNPATYPQLRLIGRRVVLTHEVTHVATRAISDESVPLWLSEGFADYVGYLREDVPVRVAAGELLTEVRTGRAPKRLPLPADADFSARDAKLATAYERAWLACRFIADTWGQRALIRFYTAVGTSDEEASAAVAAGLREVLGTTPAQFRAEWQAYVADHAE